MKRIYHVYFLISITFIIGIIIFFAFSTPFNDGSGQVDADLFSKYGNFIGGLIGPILSLITVIFLYVNLYYQNKDIQSRNFNQLFFEILKSLRITINDFEYKIEKEDKAQQKNQEIYYGFSAIKEISIIYLRALNNTLWQKYEIIGLVDHEHLDNGYLYIKKTAESSLINIFSQVLFLFEYVENNISDIKLLKDYNKIIISLLSNHLKFLIAVYYRHNHKYQTVRKLIFKYHIFRKRDFNNLINKEYREIFFNEIFKKKNIE